MHILILPSWYPKSSSDISGVFFRDQALALLNYGHKVGVISPQTVSLRAFLSAPKVAPEFSSFENDSGILTYRKLALEALPGVPYGNYWLFSKVARKLFTKYISEQGKPDIIHAHSAILGGAAAVLLGREYDIPVVLTEHSTGFAREIFMRWELRLASECARSVQSCIAVSPSLGQLLTEKLSIPSVTWKWIPNVVADRFDGSDRSRIDGAPLRFLNLALMTDKKGQRDLLKAFGVALRAGISAELWLAGDGPMRSQLEQLVRELGLMNRVRFLGLIPPNDVPALFKRVDVMVISSHYETFGVVAAEALTAGLPVIATKCGGPECIVHQGDGLLVPPNNPEALAQAMLRVGSDLVSYSPVEIAARARARFSGPAVAAQLTMEYERVVLKTSAIAS